MRTVAGGWLGEYHFDNPQHGLPCRFEATFSAVGPDGTFCGTILDDSPLGEAVVHHTRQVGEAVLFTKVYRLKHFALLPIRYEGRVLEDGHLLRGTWVIYESRRGVMKASTTGSWEARRTWDCVSEA